MSLGIDVIIFKYYSSMLTDTASPRCLRVKTFHFLNSSFRKRDAPDQFKGGGARQISNWNFGKNEKFQPLCT
jgi:hypothetical protein